MLVGDDTGHSRAEQTVDDDPDPGMAETGQMADRAAGGHFVVDLDVGELAALRVVDEHDRLAVARDLGEERVVPVRAEGDCAISGRQAACRFGRHEDQSVATGLGQRSGDPLECGGSDRIGIGGGQRLTEENGDQARGSSPEAARDRVRAGIADALSGLEDALAQSRRELIRAVVGVGDGRDGDIQCRSDILDRNAAVSGRFRASCVHTRNLPHLFRFRRRSARILAGQDHDVEQFDAGGLQRAIPTWQSGPTCSPYLAHTRHRSAVDGSRSSKGSTMERNPETQLFDRRSALRLGGVAGAAVTAGALSARQASAQTPLAGGAMSVQRQSVSLAAAQSLIEAAEAKAQEIGVPMAIAIMDDSGLLKAFHRMDGLDRALAVDLVPMKAYTAVSFRAPTHMIAEGAKDDVVMAATLASTPHFTLLGGGYPIMDGELVVGGFGVGGGSVEQDMQVAEAALSAVGNM